MEEKRERVNIAELFGENVFGDRVMRERLPKAVYQRVREMMTEGYELEPAIAYSVAQAMKEWAVENGATHYTHWFQPLSGVAAEKHDSLLCLSPERGRLRDALYPDRLLCLRGRGARPEDAPAPLHAGLKP